MTVGLEQEAMLLDPGTLDLCPRAVEVVARAGDPRFKLELPAAQIEIVLWPAARHEAGEEGTAAVAELNLI
jgi:glutamate---cysteine ligase / carboxylate-amine ligase